MKKTPAVSFEVIVLLLFALSGFAGLIYESIWTHYLKLILGHAAYAQSLVLAIFMGGMALGAWLVSRLSGRLRNLFAHRFHQASEFMDYLCAAMEMEFFA